MNKTYFPKYGPIHKGMIEIADLPTFSSVYIHIGNTIEQTAGCPLVGLSYIKKDGDFQVLQSVDAYKQVYKNCMKPLTGKDNQIEIKKYFSILKPSIMQTEITLNVLFGSVSSVLWRLWRILSATAQRFKSMETGSFQKSRPWHYLSKQSLKQLRPSQSESGFSGTEGFKLEFNQLKIRIMKQRNLNLVSRIQEPTPKWFRIVRNIGLALSAVGGVLVAARLHFLQLLLRSVGICFGRFDHWAVSQTAISSEEYGENPKIGRKFLRKFKWRIRKIAFIRRLSSTKIIQAGS